MINQNTREMRNMTKNQKAIATISTSTGLATSAAVIPIPVADSVAITGIQVAMIVSLGGIYGQVISKNLAKNLLGAFLVFKVGEWLASWVKAIPGVGTIVGGAAQMIIAGTLTYSLGLAVKHVLEKGLKPTRDNITEARKNLDKETIKAKRDELKLKIKKTKIAENRIAFDAKPHSFSDSVRFSFNASRYKKVTLRVLNSKGDTVLERNILPRHRSSTWKSGSARKGKYVAFLECGNLLPIRIDIEKR